MSEALLKLLIPPPKVIGTKHSSAIFFETSKKPF